MRESRYLVKITEYNKPILSLHLDRKTGHLTNKDVASSEAQQMKFFSRPVGVSRRDKLHNEVNPNRVVV